MAVWASARSGQIRPSAGALQVDQGVLEVDRAAPPLPVAVGAQLPRVGVGIERLGEERAQLRHAVGSWEADQDLDPAALDSPAIRPAYD